MISGNLVKLLQVGSLAAVTTGGTKMKNFGSKMAFRSNFKANNNCPGGARSVYFYAIPSSSPVQNELYLATSDFSLFVLELPFPKREAEVKFHYLFWNFRSQIEKRKLNSTICFGIFVPRLKRESRLSETNCR